MFRTIDFRVFSTFLVPIHPPGIGGAAYAGASVTMLSTQAIVGEFHRDSGALVCEHLFIAIRPAIDG